jgi:NitT/TauT family transport system substrate-binding protein
MTGPDPRRRQCLQLLLGTAAGTALSGCADLAPALRVGSIVFPTYEYVFLARELGFIQAAQVRLVEYSATTYALRALAAWQIEAAQLTLDEVIAARAAGIALSVVLVLDVSAGSDAVYARGPMTLAELAGKRVAVEEGASGALLLDGLLRAANLTVDRIHKVPSNLALSAGVFKRDEADVVVTAEPWASQIEREGGFRLFDSRQIPNRIIDVLAVRTESIEPHLSAIRQLVAGIVRARHHHLSEPAAMAVKLAPRLQLEPSQVAQAFVGLSIPTLADNRRMLEPEGQIVVAAHALQEVMLASGLLGRQQPPAALIHALVDARFLPDGDVA